MLKAERVTGAFLQGWSRDAVSWPSYLLDFYFFMELSFGWFIFMFTK